jgi:hypothetical protein
MGHSFSRFGLHVSADMPTYCPAGVAFSGGTGLSFAFTFIGA